MLPRMTKANARPTSLVTGGAGFMGSHVADQLLGAGHEVVVLDDLSGGYRDNVPEGAAFVEGSITDTGCIEQLFSDHDFDRVYHLAAYAAEGLSHFIRRFNYTNNVTGSINLINASVNRGVKCFVFTSSIAVYGPGQTPMREDMTPEPEDPYGIAKYAVELDLAAAHRMFGLDYVIFRPHNVYGERQNTADRYRNVIGIFMNQVMRGEPCSIFGDGEQTRAFSHIDDVAPMIARSPDVPAALGRIFNVGADRPYTVNELARIVHQAMGRDTGVDYLDARNEVVHAFSDHSLAHETFGRGPGIDLETGVTRMAEWAKQLGPRAATTFKGIEIEKNLPPSWRATLDG